MTYYQRKMDDDLRKIGNNIPSIHKYKSLSNEL